MGNLGCERNVDVGLEYFLGLFVFMLLDEKVVVADFSSLFYFDFFGLGLYYVGRC